MLQKKILARVIIVGTIFLIFCPFVRANTVYLECVLRGRQDASQEHKRLNFDEEIVLLKIKNEDKKVSISINGSINYGFVLQEMEQGEIKNSGSDLETIYRNESDENIYILFRRAVNNKIKFQRYTDLRLNRATGELDFFEITDEYGDGVINRKFAGKCVKAGPRKPQF